MPLHLILNPGQNGEALVGLSDGERMIDQIAIPGDAKRSEKIVSAIRELLARNDSSPADLSGIIAANGQGSFSGIRTVVTVANAMAFALNIPAVGLKADEFSDMDDMIKKGMIKLEKAEPGMPIEPHYREEPNIGGEK